MHKRLLMLVFVSFLIVFPLKGNSTDNYSVMESRIKTVKKRTVKDYKYFSGKLQPYAKAVIKSDIPLKLERVNVVNGEWVEKGQKILFFNSDAILKLIKKTENEIKGWEKILAERKKWKVRSRKSENEAKLKIKAGTAYLKKLNRFKMRPFLISPISGRISSLLNEGDSIGAGLTIAMVTDDYLLKIILNKIQSKHYSDGDMVDLETYDSKMRISGRIKQIKDKKIVLINNAKLKVRPGKKMRFKYEIIHRNAIILDGSDLGSDKLNHYIYLARGNYAEKRYINIEKFPEGRYLVISGLKDGDKILSPLPASNRQRIVLRSVESVDTGLKRAKKSKKSSYGKSNFIKGKKIEYVVSAGISISKPGNLNLRASGFNNMFTQYSKIYNLTNNHSGAFKENLLGIPLSFTANYFLKNGLIIKGGIEYTSGGNNSGKLYSFEWPDVNEKFNYSINNKITNIMPFIGIEKRFSSFALYALAGLNLTSISQTDTLDYNENSYTLKSVDEFKIKGLGPGIVLGAKYMIRIGRKNSLFFKAEYVLNSISGFSGTKTTNSSDSLGKTFSEIIDGSVYIFDYNPYNSAWFSWWDVSVSIPDGSSMKNVTDFSMKYSKMRFILGFAF